MCIRDSVQVVGRLLGEGNVLLLLAGVDELRELLVLVDLVDEVDRTHLPVVLAADLGAVDAGNDGTDIRRRDYWKVRSVDLINQINQYQQFAQLVDASQQQQYITLAQQASDDLDNVWGSTDLDETTLNRMIEDQVYLQNMDSLGIEVTDADIETYIDTQFQPADAPLISPTPSPTLIPQRAEWATQTIEAEAQEIDGTFTPTPVGGGSPVSDDLGDLATRAAGAAGPNATPVAGQDPAVDNLALPSGEAVAPATPVLPPTDASPAPPEPAASPLSGSPIAENPIADVLGSPEASPVLPEATLEAATPNPEQALQTAEAGYEAYQDGVFETAHLSDSDYRRLIVRPAVARDKVRAALTADVGQTAEQVRAAHILVDTKDLADTIYASLQEPNANFEQTAIDQSNDTSTAPNGGDLGWFTRGQMVDPFEQSAFTQAVGSISEPVQSEFGWHIIKVYERDPNRALSEQQIEQYRENIINDWLTQQRATMDISSDIEPSPTPGVSNFVPPVDAPGVPTETPELEASPIAETSPVVAASPGALASPVAEGPPDFLATPVTTPVLTSASPVAVATPAASPVMGDSPVAVPTDIATPIGSPAARATPVASPVVVPVENATAAPSSTAASTPVVAATPVIVASPVASPVATPPASSAASPIGSPSASSSP